VGLIAGVELVRDKATKAPFDPPATAGRLFVEKAQEQGLIVRNLQDTIALSPPLVISEGEVDELLRRFERALEATWKSL
jgi:4-aminobutyrate--pyruvate transaminase